MDFVDVCPPAVVERVRGADLASMENRDLFAWIVAEGSGDCQIQAIPAVAARLDADSHPLVVDAFCSAVGAYARFLPAEALPEIASAYRRIRFDPAIAHSYFLGLRATGIDLRDHLEGRVPVDWSFTDPIPSPTWHYHLYLASLDEPGALDRLAEHIARTEDGNDVTAMLNSLHELPGEAVSDILRSYSEDSRTSLAPNGPGLPISTLVGLLLQFRPQQP